MEPGTIIGKNSIGYPSDVLGSYGVMAFTVVLVAGAIGDYAAYAGQGSDDWVARHGDKLSFEMACGHFPGGLSFEKYRL